MDSIYRRKYCKYKSKYKALKINSEQTGGGDFKLVMKDDAYYYLHNKGATDNPNLDFINISGDKPENAVLDYLTNNAGFQKPQIPQEKNLCNIGDNIYLMEIQGKNYSLPKNNYITTSIEKVKKSEDLSNKLTKMHCDLKPVPKPNPVPEPKPKPKPNPVPEPQKELLIYAKTQSKNIKHQKILDYEYISNFVNNKSAMIWAFDEVINKGTEFDGNTNVKSISELSDILEYLIHLMRKGIYENIYINLDKLQKIKKVVDKTYYDIKDIKFDINNKSKCMLCGWKGHAVMIFYEKTDNKYNVGIVNAGQGVNFQGIKNNMCNGIVVFTDIEQSNVQNFLDAYSIFYANSLTDTYFDASKHYLSFYFIIFDKLLGQKYVEQDVDKPLKQQKNDTNLEQNEEEFDPNKKVQKYTVDFSKIKNKIEIQVESQILGSCTFTNHINYLCYMLYKTNGTFDYEQYSQWYTDCKFLLRTVIYKEITQIYDNRLYNIYKYILDTDTNMKKNDSYEMLIQNIPMNINYKYIDDSQTHRTISKDMLLNFTNPDNKQMLLELHNKNITPILTDQNKNSFVKDLFLFYMNIMSFDNGIEFLVPILELYKIVKLNKTLNFDSEINDIMKILPDKDNYRYNITNCKYGFFICVCILLLLYKDKKKPFQKNLTNDERFNKWKIYMRIFARTPIVSPKYVTTLDEIMLDLYLNIEYLPIITSSLGTNEYCVYYNQYASLYIYMSLGNKCKDKYERLFYDILLSNNIRNSVRLKELKEKFGNEYQFQTLYNDENNFILKSILCDINFLENTNILLYETYGYIDTNNISNDANIENNIYENGDYLLKNLGKFKSYVHKYNLFQTIRKNLSEQDQLDIQKYIVYFYLCYINGSDIEENIFKKYDRLVPDYFVKLWAIHDGLYYFIYRPIIYAYILKYEKTYSFDLHSININDYVLIHYNERNEFKLKKYIYSIQEETTQIGNDTINVNYCRNEFKNFYILTYEAGDKYYNIIIDKNKTNTIESINIIKQFPKIHNNMYLALNFYYTYTNYGNKNIMGINKYDKNITIKSHLGSSLSYNITTNNKTISYDIIDAEHTIINSDGKKFYNMMSHNDLLILMYTKDKIIYLNLGSYNIIFYIQEDKIYYDIDGVKYQIIMDNDEDIYNIYGIVRLVNTVDKNDTKLLCFYNYRNIPILFKSPKFDFINKGEKDIYTIDDFYNDDNIPKYKTFFHCIINKHNINNKEVYILKNFNDALAILLNCFTYNNYSLVFKTARQLQTIIKNNNINIKILKTLVDKCRDIYGLPIRELIYYELIEPDYQLNIYNYKYFNHLYTKYDIAFKIHFCEATTVIKYSTMQMTTQHTPKYFYYDCGFNKCNYIHRKNDINTNIKYIYDESNVKEKYIYNVDIYSGSVDGMRYIKKHIEYDQRSPNMDSDNYFKLLKVHIKNPSQEKFNSNIETAKKLFEYLNRDDRTQLFPIQELIMGSGKSSVITPYLIKLLLEKSKKEIYIVMPNSLILQSFETLMKNLFPIFNDVQIRMKNEYDINNEINEQTATIYLMDDVQFKLKFLEKKVNSDNMYVIYDEVDMIANPLSCELNIPDQITDLQNINILFELSELLYQYIFINPNFWTNKTRITNGKHNYFPKIDVQLNEYINKFYDDATTNFKNKCKSLVDYIKLNVLNFILTKQFNYDYGMPESYENIECTYNYKYKAIPYIAADLPSLGSEFSDPVLTYVLTYFCYKMADQKYRYIDKIYIINYLEIEYKKRDIHFKKFAEQFTYEIQSWETYFANKEFYLKSMKEKFNLDDATQKIILKNILNMNISYYKKCNNISFNDLLLYRNVKNFVSFTGTAYIKPPVDKNNNFPEKYIERSQIKINNKVHENTEKAIEYLLNDRNITEHIFINDDNNTTIEAIFECLGSYSVLIDIGALFVNYNNQEFINKYKEVINHKQYIVYYENERKILNIETGVYESSASIKNNNAFFYFSNKNITGVDMKDIMEPKAYGLVTITNNTLLRDFSQGVFRMRDILNGQKMDLIIDRKMITEANQILSGGQECKKRKRKNDVLSNVFKHLQEIQNEYNNQKNKILYKQNIFALIKSDTTDGNQLLYIDPSATAYDRKDINDVNIDDKTKNNNDPLISALKTKYNELKNVNTTKQNQIQSKAQEKTQEKTQEKIKQTIVTQSIMSSSSQDKQQRKIPYNIGKNIITTAITLDKHDKNVKCIFILYNDTHKILALVDQISIENFFVYNNYDDVEGYTIISFFGDEYYGKIINSNLLFVIKIIAKNIYINLTKNIKFAHCEKCTIYTDDEINFMSKNNKDIESLLAEFTTKYTYYWY